MRSALVFLVNSLGNLYLMAFLLRFILQWVRASYRNPLSQIVVKITNPLVIPARRVIPSLGGLDVPTLVVLYALECVVTWLLLMLVAVTPTVAAVLLYALLRLVELVLWLYILSLLIYVLLSWFGDRNSSPMGAVLADLTEPVLRPVRRVLPPIANLDLSPLLVMLLLQAALIALPRPPYLP